MTGFLCSLTCDLIEVFNELVKCARRAQAIQKANDGDLVDPHGRIVCADERGHGEARE